MAHESAYSTAKSDACPDITAIIITLNEEQSIARCLRALERLCSEIIVLDGGSTDNTVSIARDHDCHVSVNTDWQGFGVQKQRALNLATSEWVLSIDADELITADLSREISDAIRSNQADGYWINRRTNFLGHWMRFGGWHPDYVLRLGRREKCDFDLSPVHERLLVRGTTKKLVNSMLHYSYPTLQDVLSKQSRYAIASAQKKVSSGSIYGALYATTVAIFVFLKTYFVKLGFLDGGYGFVAAVSRAQESFWKYLGTRYLRQKK